jgi:hypothetical protein
MSCAEYGYSLESCSKRNAIYVTMFHSYDKDKGMDLLFIGMNIHGGKIQKQF